MRVTGRAAEPPLLSLQGRIDHHVLEDAIAEVRRGRYAGWQLVNDSKPTQAGGSPGRRPVLLALASMVFGQFSQPSTAPTRTVVIEHAATKRRASAAFEYLGEANGLPLWRRV